MSRTSNETTLTGIVRDILRRLANLERKVDPPVPTVPFELYPVSFSGSVSTSDECPVQVVLGGVRLTGFYATLNTAGTTTTTVVAKRNGSAISGASVSFGSGDTYKVVQLAAPQRFDLGDTLRWEVTAAGTGAVGLGVFPMVVP